MKDLKKNKKKKQESETNHQLQNPLMSYWSINVNMTRKKHGLNSLVPVCVIFECTMEPMMLEEFV